MKCALHLLKGLERPKNVHLSMVCCSCGEYHIHVTLLSNIGPGDLLVPADFGAPMIFCEFDGSAHRSQEVGGAGAAMYVISAQGLQLLAWSCISIVGCKDNIVAEVYGADLSMKLYDRYMNMCAEYNVRPLPLDRIQGDILPLLNHLRFQSRFRRQDLVPVIDRFHLMRSCLAPTSSTEYRPREANFVADYLAGRASALLLDQHQTERRTDTIQEYQVDPPYELLLSIGEHIDGKLVVALCELPSCTFQALSLVPQTEPHVQKALCHIALSTRKLTTAHTVEYVASATHGAGRVYAKQACAQILPKAVRAYFFANTHQEVDMVGAHYELIRRHSHTSSLPPMTHLRQQLQSIWEGNYIVAGENVVKMFPIRVINTSAASALRFLQMHHLQTAGYVTAIAYDLETAKNACASTSLKCRTGLDVNHANRGFFACEFLETRLMCCFVRALQRRHRCSSIIWLHDGIWISKTIPITDIRAAEKEAVTITFPQCPHTNPLFLVRELSRDYCAGRERLSCPPAVAFVFPPGQGQVTNCSFTNKHPGPLFTGNRSHVLDDSTYHDRVHKRRRCI